ncbi:MAG: PRC-barrel domain-containing protein [Euryarchaeota archaeon]|nr:PRC-barrel domain-containing protein [Euryarchaeota archaeon]
MRTEHEKGEEREGREKTVAYLRSRLFPWNFVFEPVEEDAIKHFVTYALQICEEKGIEKGTIPVPVTEDDVKELITKEVKEAVNEYLFDVDDGDIAKTHGKYAVSYPFAFAQCLVHTILYRLGLELEDVMDVKAIGDLLGQNIEEIRRSESFIRNLISKRKKRAMKMFSKSILNMKIITAGGEYIGNVGNIVFDIETGNVGGLIVNHQKQKGAGRDLEKGRISLHDVRLNIYSKNVVLKYSSYK